MHLTIFGERQKAVTRTFCDQLFLFSLHGFNYVTEVKCAILHVISLRTPTLSSFYFSVALCAVNFEVG